RPQPPGHPQLDLQPEELRLPARGARLAQRPVRRPRGGGRRGRRPRLGRRLPRAASGRPGLHLVEQPRRGARQQRRLAHRLPVRDPGSAPAPACVLDLPRAALLRPRTVHRRLRRSTGMSEAAQRPRYKGWAGIRQAFATPSALTLAVLGFGCGLPFLPIASMTLSTRLRDGGLDLGSIGLISLASFFYLLKFLWPPLIDRYVFAPLGLLGRRRSWLLAAQLGVAAGLAALAFTRPELGVGPLVGWVLFTSFAGATQDSVVDAYRIEVAPAQAQAALAATYTLGYRIGLILGGAGALYLAEFGGWTMAYLAMAALMLAPVLATLLSREPDAPESTITRRIDFLGAFWQPFSSYFANNGLALGLVLLLFVGLFKFPDQVIG